MSDTQREQLLRSLYEAFNARDLDTCLAAMAPDVDWANGVGGRTCRRPRRGPRVLGTPVGRDRFHR